MACQTGDAAQGELHDKAAKPVGDVWLRDGGRHTSSGSKHFPEVYEAVSGIGCQRFACHTGSNVTPRRIDCPPFVAEGSNSVLHSFYTDFSGSRDQAHCDDLERFDEHGDAAPVHFKRLERFLEQIGDAG